MALDIHSDELIRNGDIADQTKLARLLHVSQPRMTQIMNLLHLAPDIQEELLFLPRTVSGRDPIHEKLRRPITAEMDWGRQRGMWVDLRSSANMNSVRNAKRDLIHSNSGCHHLL